MKITRQELFSKGKKLFEEEVIFTSEEVKDEPLEMYKELVINDRINQIYENAFFDDKNSDEEY